ncbi:helix-turn-helix domain-containing protein [Chryseobacterium foetidum]|uniref:helix-turn-helix domain-containing protein n=1 Tax=Chryseobacterium foetidum TaxID=2951057 RepID=UPI0021C8DFED|nr:AraC family transcriptional regulator [Chryseobacterium foetidum]
MKFKEYEVVTISTFYTFFILYYMVKFIEIKNKTSTEGETDPSVEIPAFSLNVADASPLREEDSRVERLQHLYNRIIILFEEEKPFQYPEFNIRTLADKVNSNTSYVSAALNKMGNKKFNQLVNEYRIEQVKILMKENVHYKFTLEHIYTNAGFSSQSTFNRIFKEHTGLTPTEYIERL